MWQWIALGLAGWIAVLVVLGLLVGRVISRAGTGQESAERATSHGEAHDLDAAFRPLRPGISAISNPDGAPYRKPSVKFATLNFECAMSAHRDVLGGIRL